MREPKSWLSFSKNKKTSVLRNTHSNNYEKRAILHHKGNRQDVKDSLPHGLPLDTRRQVDSFQGWQAISGQKRRFRQIYWKAEMKGNTSGLTMIRVLRIKGAI